MPFLFGVYASHFQSSLWIDFEGTNFKSNRVEAVDHIGWLATTPKALKACLTESRFHLTCWSWSILNILSRPRFRPQPQKQGGDGQCFCSAEISACFSWGCLMLQNLQLSLLQTIFWSTDCITCDEIAKAKCCTVPFALPSFFLKDEFEETEEEQDSQSFTVTFSQLDCIAVSTFLAC